MTELVVTRPAEEAGPWADALRAAGWDVRVWPLIEVAPVPDAEPLLAWARDWTRCDAVMWVSAAAVKAFDRAVQPAWPDWATRVPRCWAPGPGTAAALRAVGVPTDRIDAPSQDAGQFDSEALWPVVSNQVIPGHRLLLVRGSSDGTPPIPQAPALGLAGRGRDWLAGQCLAAGGQVQACVAYRRHAPDWSPERRAQASDPAADRLWLFSSSEAVQHLGALCPGTDWSRTRARALVTHPRIGVAAQALGFREIITTRPALADVLRGLPPLL